jgi:hypothetical protein
MATGIVRHTAGNSHLKPHDICPHCGRAVQREQVDISGEAHNWALARDRLHWRITLSPEDWDRMNIRDHVRACFAHRNVKFHWTCYLDAMRDSTAHTAQGSAV